MMRVAVLDPGSGNLASVAQALRHVAAEQDAVVEVTDRPESIAAADRVVVPGQGAFADVKHGIERIPGLREAIEDSALRRGRPFLGICVGLQILAQRGHEHGVTEGWGWLAGEIVPLAPLLAGVRPPPRIPHMGWNQLAFGPSRHPVFSRMSAEPSVYFAHSYVLDHASDREVLARASYGVDLAVAAGRDNFAGVQFHPEKSQREGLALLAGFLAWRP